MRAITGLTAAYIIIMATTMFYSYDPGSKISGIIFGEALFSSPIIISCILSLFLKRFEARGVMLLFGVGFSIFSLSVFYSTFAGERDAQYQLTLLLIPAVGFPAVAIAGAIAAFWNWGRR
jgi:hypothetical protein